MITPPTGTVTFLFTDIEGSTRLACEHPEALEDTQARRQHLLPENYEALKRGFEAAQPMPV